ncbi:TVP38/TMEM64 family protein [Parvimonas parva]|uniref:TVP38/TMEM64 family membrane protein n=1 Tax=Parvimonas parva TaxID=2769485 RepID=A0ABS1C8Z2_9FIRM|nr:VTT domain-containing protein [Parvimonas parva]MBK1468576.1 TVP38/TMEM64 family protein [Parvimonas parva]
MSKKKIITLISVILIVIISYYIFKIFTPEKIRNIIQGYGKNASFIYILLFSILPIFFFPVPILAIVAGISFGLFEGVLYTMIGAMINSSIMFVMAKKFAKDKVVELFKTKISKKWYNKMIAIEKNNGFLIIFLLRLLPIAPYNVINYLSGLTEISFLRYSLATFLGIIPGTFVFLNVGDKAINVYSVEFVISLLGFLLLTIFSIILIKKVDKN